VYFIKTVKFVLGLYETLDDCLPLRSDYFDLLENTDKYRMVSLMMIILVFLIGTEAFASMSTFSYQG
jgi:hypothetical protein